MVLGQDVSQFEFLDLGDGVPLRYTAGLAAAQKGCDGDKNFINKTGIEECSVERGPTLTKHPLSTKIGHLMECFWQVNRVDSTLNQICYVGNAFYFDRIGVCSGYDNGALRRSSEHRQREVEIKPCADDSYTSNWPCSTSETPCFGADAGRGRVVAFSHCCGATNQNDVGQRSYRAENVFVTGAAKRTRNTFYLGDIVNGRNHVDHQPRTVGQGWPVFTINIVNFDFENGRRK